MDFVVVGVVALSLALLTYLGIERLGKAAWIPATLRAVALGALGLLLVNSSCERPAEALRPIALLDASLSMGAAGGSWDTAHREARAKGDVRLIGSIDAKDSTPTGGRSAVSSELLAAAATGRPVWLYTDGEIEDLALIPPDVLNRVGVRVFPRPQGADLAITRIDAPGRVAIGDTLRVQVEVTGSGMDDRKQVVVEVRSGAVRWMTGPVVLRNGSGTAELETVLKNVAAGEYALDVSIKDAGDAEPRTDSRMTVLHVTPTPGIVVITAAPGWESRFLFKVLGEVAALPVRGYLGLPGGEWRRLGELTRVPAVEVEQAARRADLLTLFGDLPASIRGVTSRARWEFVGTSRVAAAADGDWYLAAGVASPVSGAFVGLPLDSFPPAVALVTLSPGPNDWVGLSSQLNRRGVERPAVIGRDSAGRREVTVGVAGLWRWAFRGGASEQAYRAWVAATASWLLGGSDSATGVARPVRLVSQRGRPIVFERTRPNVTSLPVTLRGPDGQRVDTLRFDGMGRADLTLPPGEYRYQLARGGSGTLAVERYSDELLRRPVALESREAITTTPATEMPLRDKRWLFGLIIVALAGEWWWRRRTGLR